MWSAPLFSLVLLFLSVGLVMMHMRTYRAATANQLDEMEYQYIRQQYRRRMLASSAIGVVAVALSAGLWIHQPIAALFYWSGVMLTVCWIGLLGVADWFSTRAFFQRQRRQNAARETELKAELREMQQIESDSDDERF